MFFEELVTSIYKLIEWGNCEPIYIQECLYKAGVREVSLHKKAFRSSTLGSKREEKARVHEVKDQKRALKSYQNSWGDE